MRGRTYDNEFSPEILAMLKERSILERANRAQGFILVYGLSTEVERLIRQFEKERKENPVLETTPPEAWLAAQLVPKIREIRPNVDVEGELVSEAVQRKLRICRQRNLSNQDDQTLHRSIEFYRPCLESLFVDLFDPSRSLRSILRLRRGTYTVRDLGRDAKPFTKLEDIVLRCLKDRQKPVRIARTLDEADVRPRSFPKYKSYVHMLQINAQSFYSLTNNIKAKYRDRLTDSASQSKPKLK